MSDRVEQLAREFHTVYQAEAQRQGDVRHADDYDQLPENIKEFDRVLARHVAAQVTRLEEERDEYIEKLQRMGALHREAEASLRDCMRKLAAEHINRLAAEQMLEELRCEYAPEINAPRAPLPNADR